VTDEIARKRVEKLTDKGIDHLQGGRYQEAIQVAAELEDSNGPLAFYLAGEAYAGMKDIKKAVASMRRGVLAKPTVWWNWFFLGIYLGRLHRFEEALAALNQSLLCPEADRAMVHLNMAIFSVDWRQYDTALGYLDGIDNPAMRWGIDGTRVLALEGVGRIDEAAELAEKFLKDRPQGDEEYDKRAGFVAAALARFRLRQGLSKEEVRTFLLQCLDEYGCSTEVLREIACLKELRYSVDSKYYRFVMQATLPAGHPWYRAAGGYYVMYDVISDSESAALEMINEFESAAGIESLEVMECQIRGERPQDPMGVCWVTERFFS
jgi:tetratricopeptide (TPR) repeat protein